ncbi:MAG TPA: hypothetical protein PKC65_02845 [Pyrinomonadaceae bacterium]|nr:hypothetical protein [Pyrinomonadaceae bacterium]
MRFAKAAGTIFLALVFSAVSFAQGSAVVPTDLSQQKIDEIIKKFTENEEIFRSALTDYVFNRKALVQTIGLGGQVSGTFRRDSFMTFGEDGGRFEKVLYAPIATTEPGFVTPEDLEDLGGVNPFALEPRSIPQYNFRFAGTEHIDELDLYVFDVTPKEVPDPKKTKLRLFTGRIWVDKTDLMIVRSKGKAVPETKVNKFPIVLTTRAQIDGKYWFPVDARSDDELVFDNGRVIKIRMRVTYSDYRQGRTDVVIKDEPEPTPEPPKKQ